MKEIRILAATLGLVLLAQPLAAKDSRFSGRWVLNREKTQVPQLPDITIEISQAEGVVHYRRTVKDAQNVWLTQLDLPPDGQEGSYTHRLGDKLKCSGVFRDGNFILDYQDKQRRSGKWVILEMKDELSLSADGKTLSVVHEEHWDGKGGRSPHPMVFDRQTE